MASVGDHVNYRPSLTGDAVPPPIAATLVGDRGDVGARQLRCTRPAHTVAEQRANASTACGRHAPPRRRLGRWLPAVWLAACLLAAAFCFGRVEALKPTQPTRTPANPPPRYVTRSIEDIREGDMVLARDEFGQDLGMKRVAQVYRRVSDHLRLLTFRTADGTEQTLKTTNEHPFWVEKRHAWVEAKDLVIGDTFTGPRGELQTLTATSYEAHPEGISVFNFQVEDYHSYFAGATVVSPAPVLAHNADEYAPDLPTLDASGKVHGTLPKPEDLKGYSRDELEGFLGDLKQSVRTRIKTTAQLGRDRAHGQRQGAEQQLIRFLEKLLDG